MNNPDTKAGWEEFDIEALSLNDLKEKYPDLIYSDWFKGEKFADEKAQPGRYEICFQHPDSTNKTYPRQLESRPKDKNCGIPHIAVLVQGLISYFVKTGERLLPNTYSRSSTSSDGCLVYAGDFNSDGLYVDYAYPGRSYAGLGVSFSRNLGTWPLKPRDKNGRFTGKPTVKVISSLATEIEFEGRKYVLKD